jgi:hypothetical protein
MKRTSLVAIIVSALVIIGIVFYLARPRTDESESARPREVSAPAQPATEPSGAPAALVSCTGPVSSQVPIASLAARHQWAHSLLVSNHLDSSLTELRNIATLDPGYPAINLEISDALVKAKRASEAKDAVKLQVEISECLANLPPSGMEDYCKTQWVSEPQGGCAAELARINQQAHYEAGRVDAELAHTPEPHPAPAIATSAVAPPRTRVAPPPSASPAIATAVIAAVKPAAAPPVVAPPAAPINIKSAEAADHIGEVARVCGEIVSKHTADTTNGKPTFINLDRPFPNPAFTVLVWDADAPAVGDLPETGNLCVTGTLITYHGTPEIVVHDAKSWSKMAKP